MLAEALKRTLLLMRSDLSSSVTDEELIAALVGTTVVISAADDVLQTSSGQSAVVAAAILMARQGHDIFLNIPDAPLIGEQPPLTEGSLVAALTDCGIDLLPGKRFHVGVLTAQADLAVIFGEVPAPPAAQTIALTASDWSASLSDEPSAWLAGDWPIGALAAAALAAGEAFKASMRRLRHYAASAIFDDFYAPSVAVQASLAPEKTPPTAKLGEFDLISGGAIANAALFVLLRLPQVSGKCRVLDDDTSAMSNLNRNALLRRSRLEVAKVEDLASYSNGLSIKGVPVRFGSGSENFALAETVLVGVDHVPSRWAVQERAAGWIGVGATDRFMVQVSSHVPGQPCAGCTYPYGNDPGADIPTVAFVSFWSGLLLAIELLRQRCGQEIFFPNQRLFCALRPESVEVSCFPLAFHFECPLRCGVSKAA